MRMITIILADDHKLIRDGVKSLLADEPSITIAGEVANGKELLDVLSRRPADVILMDINMPVMDGYEATRQIRENYPGTQVLVLSMNDHEKYVSQMFEAGALGYILKNTGRDELVHAIRMVAGGHKYLSADIGVNLLNKASQNLTKPVGPKETGELSKREMEVLHLIAEGFTNAEIADKLYTSKRTVESHRQNLLEKTHCNNTATLIRYAVAKGLIEVE
jgi:DNA-binding NarL/FixJ family response regulator